MKKLIPATRWMNLINIILSERSQTQKIQFIRIFQEMKISRDRLLMPGAGGGSTG